MRRRGRGSAKVRSAVVATIKTREDLMRVMDAKCCIALITVVEATRHLAREVVEGDFATNSQQRATNVAATLFLKPCMLWAMDWLLKRRILIRQGSGPLSSSPSSLMQGWRRMPMGGWETTPCSNGRD
jgi:hypothetical protein